MIIIAAIIHEYSHAWMADRLGDQTPRMAGRLTINPIPHIDPWGTIFLPFLLYFINPYGFLIAYAKPVPFNPYALRNQKYGSALVGLAGPAVNLLLAFSIGALIRFLSIDQNLFKYLLIAVHANLVLAIFNLVPIPPLDGSKLLYAFLPDSLFKFKVWMEQYGIVLLVVFIIFLSPYLNPVVEFVRQLATG